MKKRKVNYRPFLIIFIFLLCIMGGFYLSAKVYENTLATGFGIYKKAVCVEERKIRIFDFEIELG